MRTFVFDLEANGLRPDTVFCLVGKDLEQDRLTKFAGPGEIEARLPELEYLFHQYDRVVAHNLLGYDRFVLSELLGIHIPFHKCFDTLVVSRILYPDRPVPVGFNSKEGPHSIGAWGFRLGMKKPSHEDWSQYSEYMLHRCTVDVEINEAVYHELLSEAGGNL